MTVLENRFSFRVRWSPFLLRPNCPRDGLPNDEPLGGDMTNPRVLNLKEVGRSLGIEFNLNCPVYPYTVPAHVLIDYARTVQGGELQNKVVDRLFRAYFTKGRPLAKKHLLQIAKDVNFNLNIVEEYLADPENEGRVKERSSHWRGQGVEAIPFFFINGESAGAGAQEVDEFIQLLTQMAEKYPSHINVKEKMLEAGETPL